MPAYLDITFEADGPRMDYLPVEPRYASDGCVSSPWGTALAAAWRRFQATGRTDLTSLLTPQPEDST